MHEPEYAKVEISQLQLDPSNARLHPEKNLAAIKGSLAKFGQQRPILVDRRNVVIAGNGTLAAARSLGWTTIDVKYTDLSGTEAIAYALADNRTSELAEWDKDILGSQLQALYEDGFGIADIGFDPGKFLPTFDEDESSVQPSLPEYLVVVECLNEEHQAKVFQELSEAGEKCKIM